MKNNIWESRINLYGYSPEKAISYNLHKVGEFNEL